jgi:hypothetical protein
MLNLFSYGTLQQPSVQISTFGRFLEGSADNLIGCIIAELKILDEDVIIKSGKDFHPIAKFSGLRQNRIPGTVYLVTEEELKHADHYEVESYQRILTKLESGKIAWVYVEATLT